MNLFDNFSMQPKRDVRRIAAYLLICRDENGTDIFRSYSRSNSFREVEICPYPSPNV